MIGLLPGAISYPPIVTRNDQCWIALEIATT